MIYKPTDLSPSAQTFDVMDTPIFFECKVDTSNVQVSGFTIEVLDSENNVVFSSIPEGKQLDIKYITILNDVMDYVRDTFPAYEDGYSLLNTGYNGSYLKFPFSISPTMISTNLNDTSKKNQIIYISGEETSLPAGMTIADEDKSESGLYRYNYIDTDDGYIIDSRRPLVPVKIYNGKEYKWSITLYQLENKGTTKNPLWVLPGSPLVYDMSITTGTVLGSNNKRIQSVLSDEIYSDYYIQPLKITGLKYDEANPSGWTFASSPVNGEEQNITQVGSRTLIKSYDMSFGYIYPVEGDDGIPEENIKSNNANAFRIYKYGNNRENLTQYQKVDFVVERTILNNEWRWTSSIANPSESYATEEWNRVTDDGDKYYPPSVFNDDNNKPSDGLSGGERIVFNGGYINDSDSNVANDSFNGIFYPMFSFEPEARAEYIPIKSETKPGIDVKTTLFI